MLCAYIEHAQDFFGALIEDNQQMAAFYCKSNRGAFHYKDDGTGGRHCDRTAVAECFVDNWLPLCWISSAWSERWKKASCFSKFCCVLLQQQPEYVYGGTLIPQPELTLK